MTFDDGRDYRTRHLGSVTDHGGDRINVQFGPKSGGTIRLEGDVVTDCDGWELPNDDGYCRDYQALVANLTRKQATKLAWLLRKAARESKAFFAETPPEPAVDAAETGR
jgi:hypothetical protein